MKFTLQHWPPLEEGKYDKKIDISCVGYMMDPFIELVMMEDGLNDKVGGLELREALRRGVNVEQALGSIWLQ